MNASKKNKCFDAIPRVRKRNSTSYKAASNHGVQGRASLLKNNKTLAVTLQETRCQLSNYKTFFEESLEYISKVKIAKSKMVQLSSAVKDFVKSFDEALLSMEFDESKWIHFKASTQSFKSFESEMNPVMEVADESFDQKASCEEKNDENYKCSTDQPMQVPENIAHGGKEDPKISFESPHKEEKLDSQVGKAKENVDMKKKIANLSSHTVKGTKIPRCKVLSVDLKSQKESKQKNKVCKRKSLQKKSEDSVPNFSRRKTFVVKSSNVLVDSEPKDNVLGTVDNEDIVNADGIADIPQDALILKNVKRKTFVKKSSEILKNPTFATPLNSLEDKESEINIDKASAMQEDDLIVKNNKRKTFVKASSLQTVCDQDNEYQAYVPNKECAPLEAGNHDNDQNGEDLKLCSDLQPYVCLSEIDNALCNNKEISLEKIEPTEAVTSLNVDATTSAEEVKIIDEIPSAEEPLSSEDKTKQDSAASETSSKEIKESDQISIVYEPPSFENKMVQDVMNKAAIFDDCLELSDLDWEKMSANVRQSTRQCSKNYKIYLESSDSDCEEIPQIESFHEKKKTFEVTPVRKLITNKKKKFFFDAKKRKSALKKESICKVRKSEIDSKYLEKNTKVGGSDVSKDLCNDESDVNNREVEHKNAVHFRLDDLVSKGHSDNIESDTDKVSKKKSKTRRIKDVCDASVESAHHEKEKDDKGRKIKNGKKNLLKNKPTENSSPSKMKTKKKNIKPSDHDDGILKFSEKDNFTRDTCFQYSENNSMDDEEPPEADFPCKKTGVNTFLVHAEVHPPPPSSGTPPHSVEELNKENHMLNLQNMQVAVVLEDVFKSSNIGFLNLSDKNSLCRKTVSLKVPLSAATNNIAIDPNESIEKIRSDEGANNSDLQIDALLDVGGAADLHGDAVLGTEKPKSRRRKEVNYKEPPRNTKMRRC